MDTLITFSESGCPLLPLASGALHRHGHRVDLGLNGRNHAVKRSQFGIVRGVAHRAAISCLVALAGSHTDTPARDAHHRPSSGQQRAGVRPGACAGGIAPDSDSQRTDILPR